MAHISKTVLLFTLFLFTTCCSGRQSSFDSLLKLSNEVETGLSDGDATFPGTKWALLIAGSAGYGNYRHQSDICHAYQLLRQNGLKEENIVVFMADDIAYNPENPYPGTLINKPGGEDVYGGVPKDYTGRNVTVSNFLAVLKGDKRAIRGGSGKAITSGPNDHVFVYYSDHGGPGILGMPTFPFLFADDIVNALVVKHGMRGYKELVFYLEACESGSIFEGLLPPDINVYATTASNSMESSWGTYCPGMQPSPPPEFETCLGDLYSVAWMEDSDVQDLEEESLRDQYMIVKERTSNHATYDAGSHVMQYGDLKIYTQKASFYLGSNPGNRQKRESDSNAVTSGGKVGTVLQRDADMLHLWHKYRNAQEGSVRKAQALEEMQQLTEVRAGIDSSIELINRLLSPQVVKMARPRPEGSALVDDWECLRSMVRVYESKCGHLTQYGMKHTRTFANLCNAGVEVQTLGVAASQACMGTTRHLEVGGEFSA